MDSEPEISVDEDQVAEVLAQLKEAAADPTAMARLHEVERMIVDEVLKESRHLRCPGCLRWMTALVKKARGENWLI